MRQIIQTDTAINRKKKVVMEVVLLAVCLLFYLLFPFFDGPVWCADSASYAFMDISREPLYPAFLALTRIRGAGNAAEADAYIMTVILQSLLAGFSAWYAGFVIKRTKDQSTLMQIAAIVFQFAVVLLCRFAAVRGSVYTDCIMTEGLGLSLFVLFILELYLYVAGGRKCHLLWTLILSFLLISLRKQMMITILIMGAVFGWYILIRNRKVRKFLCLMLLMVSVLAACKVTDRLYNYAVRGVWIEHCHNSMGVLCTLLYSSDAEKDKLLFTDETIKELYLEIMKQADEQKLLYAYAQGDWLSMSSHYADSYDAIGYGIINPVVDGYIAGHYDYTIVEAALKYDEICGEMTRTLFKQNLMPMLQVYCYNVLKGLVNSVARAGHLLSIYAAAAYLGFAAAAGYLILQKKKLKEMEMQIERSLAFAFIVMMGIVINSLVVGLIIFTQPRYMIYSMGLFYAAYAMLLYDVVRCHILLHGKKTSVCTGM